MTIESQQTINTLSRLSGMQDLTEDFLRQKQGFQNRLSQLLGDYGYQMLETPVLEPTELFMSK